MENNWYFRNLITQPCQENIRNIFHALAFLFLFSYTWVLPLSLNSLLLKRWENFKSHRSAYTQKYAYIRGDILQYALLTLHTNL